jgi:hypothetical protein
MMTDLPQPTMDPWIIMTDGPDIALEQSMVSDVEPDNGDEETEVSLGESVTNEIFILVEDFLHAIESFKQSNNRSLISFLRGGKASFIDTI